MPIYLQEEQAWCSIFKHGPTTHLNRAVRAPELSNPSPQDRQHQYHRGRGSRCSPTRSLCSRVCDGGSIPCPQPRDCRATSRPCSWLSARSSPPLPLLLVLRYAFARARGVSSNYPRPSVSVSRMTVVVYAPASTNNLAILGERGRRA